LSQICSKFRMGRSGVGWQWSGICTSWTSFFGTRWRIYASWTFERIGLHL